ncbi:MAG: ROK family protein, partial [Kiritimatiellae bacterium]|nr:ROK family protein [Kiritimatiellia bacterium]
EAWILGIDIGGTKTGVCLAHPDGTILHERRMPSLPGAGPEDWLSRCRTLIIQLLDTAGLALNELAITGISAPGPLSTRTGALLNAPNMTGWEEVPVVSMFQRFIPGPIVMNNDANAAALAEWMYGSYSGADGLIYLTMSTGLGAGIIANGRLLQGVCDTAGEVGYHVLDLNGPESPCGHRGSFEAFCGGKNVADQLRVRIAQEGRTTRILEHAGGDLTRLDFRCLAEAVREGDDEALRIWEGYVLRLGQGIGNLIMILNPEVVLLGTIGIHASDILLEPLRAVLPRFVLKPALEACTIAPSSLGGRIGNMAAVALAVQELEKRS